MNIAEVSILVLFYHFVGLTIIAITGFAGAVDAASGVEFVNPYFIHAEVKVNKIVATVLALFYTVLLPVPAICYWLYKLCIFWRKADA